MSNEFGFSMPVKVLFGRDTAKKTGEFVKGQSVMVVTDGFLAGSQMFGVIKDALKDKRLIVFDGVTPNPLCKTVDAAAQIARENRVTDIVGFGGGSCLDAAKAVSCLAVSGGRISEYQSGGKVFTGEPLRLILIPTTAGTGSEVTNVGVFTNEETHLKIPFVSEKFWAKTAIIDPLFTLSMPKKTTASTGFDAFCHAMETYWSVNATPVSDALAMAAVKLVVENMQTVLERPRDIDARENMSVASTTAGIAFAQTRTTALHAVSFPLTNLYQLDHGAACLIPFAPYMERIYGVRKEKFDSLAQYCGFSSFGAFFRKIKELIDLSGLPQRLSQIGVKKEDLEMIADISIKPDIYRFTPVALSRQELIGLLEEIL